MNVLYRRMLLLLLFGLFAGDAAAQDTVRDRAARDQPVQALLVTGGCCHDYDRQKLILTRGIAARADVRWTVVHQGGTTTDTPIPLYNDPNWAKGFDVVVHNECFAHVKDGTFVDRVLRPHREGTPAILIHCAMHCYRTGDNRWFEFVGVESPGHGPHYSYGADNLEPEHPIMAGMGPRFVAPKGELYHAAKVFETATPLAQANRQSDGKPQVCVWTNDYHGTRVFGTTIGHYNETMAEPKYLDMLARGLLWAVGRDPAKEFTPTTEAFDEEIKALTDAPIEAASGNQLPQNCCGDGNLAFGRPVTAKSEQDGNFTKHLTDGLLNTRWCASGPQPDEWARVDLQEPRHLRAIRLHWEKRDGVAYRYVVEASPDDDSWKLIVDASKNEEPGGVRAHQVDAPDTRYLRVTFLGASQGLWGSIWELEATAGELPELAEIKQSSGGPPASIADVQAPPGFAVTMFGVPPEVNYPVCLTAAPTGELFVGVDEQGSLGKEPGRGKVLRCIDTDGDGQADRINEFATMDHPRGLVYDNGSLWVLHPPLLSVFYDDDLNGTADRQETLITGISTDQVSRRGADHTTNGIRMGIDGWLYIAVGDYGFTHAEAHDGTVLSRRGGGIVRVRPDGTEMEIYCWGLRNILDVSIDPYMNVFTRDNTNDGGGWDIRVSHIFQSAEYGYPSLYKNFSEEIMPPLANYGGGSGCGTMFLHDARWPQEFGNALYTCDWGRNEVYRHNLPPNAATFDPHQETFLKLQRPTDIDVDGSGRMYVSSWKNGKFGYSGPNVGYVAQITPADFLPKPFPKLTTATDARLVELLAAPSAVHRLHGQREILRRGGDARRREALRTGVVLLARDASVPLYGRVAAIFTLKQLDGARSQTLVELAGKPAIREFALRALADRKSQLGDVPLEPFLNGLADPNRRVRAQALIGLGRLGRKEVAERILPLSVRASDAEAPTAEPLWNQPDPPRVLPHLAVRALVSLGAVDACLKAVDGPYRSGALGALKSMHDERAVSGLFHWLSTTPDRPLRHEILTTLIRLYHREGDYQKGWWGTRPDTSGPYYDRQTWSASPRIADAMRVALTEADPATREHILEQLARHSVKIEGLPTAESIAARVEETQQPIVIPQIDPSDPNLIANLPPEEVLQRVIATPGDPKRGEPLFRQQACVACHTHVNGQNPKGPHLVDIGRRYKRAELAESLLKPSAKIAQGFDTWSFMMESGKVVTGFVVTETAADVILRETNGLPKTLPKDEIEQRSRQKISIMPLGLVNNLTPQQLADLIAWLESLR